MGGNPNHDRDYIWTTRDGMRLKLREMSDEHLINAAKFIERKMQERLETMRNFGLTINDASMPMSYHQVVSELEWRGIINER